MSVDPHRLTNSNHVVESVPSENLSMMKIHQRLGEEGATLILQHINKQWQSLYENRAINTWTNDKILFGTGRRMASFLGLRKLSTVYNFTLSRRASLIESRIFTKQQKLHVFS